MQVYPLAIRLQSIHMRWELGGVGTFILSHTRYFAWPWKIIEWPYKPQTDPLGRGAKFGKKCKKNLKIICLRALEVAQSKCL